MMIKTFLKPMISLTATTALALAMLGLSATPAAAGSVSAFGGERDFLRSLLVISVALVHYSLRGTNNPNLVRRVGPQSLILTQPLGDGTRLQVFVHKGKLTGYMRTM